MKKSFLLTVVLLFAIMLFSSFAANDGKILADGTYCVDVEFEGGTGKAKIISPALLNVSNGAATVTVFWNSKSYDYMIVDGVKYMNQTPGDSSSFTFPITELGKTMDVIGNTVAMSKPHEIEYKLTFTLSE
ncbi:MAG: hypothetical protein J5747_01375 [Spirochaetaceae bacterium]|nr:hypothetical protein [Spirochaetaceae bacterium]